MMKLADVSVRQDADRCRLVATIRNDERGAPFELMFEYPREVAPLLSASADPFVPALLVPCMALCEPLEITPAISPRLYASLDTIQTILTQWWSALRRVQVVARPSTAPTPPSRRTSAAFFSGGVDSFYTCLKHAGEAGSAMAPRLTHLIHMAGVEKPLEQSTDMSPLRESIRGVAEHYGLSVIFGNTNIRSVFPLSWSWYYHGAGLSSIGLSLAAGFSRILIPSTHSFRHLLPWGSHPLLDPLWSTETMEIVHDGCEVTRVEKTAAVARDPYALERLRVCLRNNAALGNCGRCKKCIRTMVTLSAMGLLQRASTFPSRLPAGFDRLLPVDSDNDRAFVEEILDYIEQHDPDSSIAKALSRRIRQSKRHSAARSYIHNSGLAVAVPAMRQLRGAAVRLASIISHIG
jgi:hypothetical protein